MKYITLFLSFLLSFVYLYANHGKGGYITYQYLSPLTYQVILVTFTDYRSSSADRPVITLSFGYKDKYGLVAQSDVSRSAIETLSVANFTQKNIYTTTHTFPGAGSYHISFADPNLADSIVNLSNSVSTPSYINSLLTIDGNGSCDNSPQFDIPAIFNYPVGKLSVQGMNVWDNEGDSLSFSLVPTMVSDSQTATGYFDPPGSRIVNDRLEWKPQYKGAFIFTMRINEWRNKKRIGWVTYQWVSQASSFSGTDSAWLKSDCTGNSSCVLIPDSSGTVKFSVSMKKQNAKAVNFQLYKPGVIIGTQPVFSISKDSAGNSMASFSWKPGSQPRGMQPYRFVFRGTADYGMPYMTDQEIYIPLPGYRNSCSTVSINKERTPSEEFQIIPNPFHAQALIRLGGHYSSVTCIIYDVRGKYMRTLKNFDCDDIILFRGDLPAGMFLYHIVFEDGKSKVGKFIIQ